MDEFYAFVVSLFAFLLAAFVAKRVMGARAVDLPPFYLSEKGKLFFSLYSGALSLFSLGLLIFGFLNFVWWKVVLAFIASSFLVGIVYPTLSRLINPFLGIYLYALLGLMAGAIFVINL